MPRLVQALVNLVVLVALWAHLSRAPERGSQPVAGAEVRVDIPRVVSYPQWRHLIVSAIFLVLAIWVLLWFVEFTRAVLVLLGISIVLAVALRPTVDRISSVRIPRTRRTLPRPLAILLIYLALALIVAGIGLAAIPPLVSEAQNLIASLPDYIAAIDERLQGLQRYFPVPTLATLEQQVFDQILGNLTQAFSVLLIAINVLTGLLSIGVVLVLTFFLIVDADRIYEHVLSLLPRSRYENMEDMAGKMGRKVEGWLKGTLLLALILGVATTAAMYALGMPYPYLLGLGAAIFELVPIIGPYLGAAPAVIVAIFSGSLLKAIAVVLYFIVIQQIENNVLAPHIFGREAEMPPLLIIMGLLLGATLYGIIGALLAVPAAGILQVLWLDLVVPEIQRRRNEA